MLQKRLFFLLLLLAVLQIGCYRMRSSNGGAQVENIAPRSINAADVALPPGYKIEAVATGLTFPSGAAFDDEGKLYVIETGYAYGETWDVPRLLRVEDGGRTTVIATGPQNGPWTGITWHEGAFYVAEGGQADGGRILRISKEGAITPLITNLPSVGDHHTNGPVIKNGYIYFSIGTATNSAVVGADNAEFGWLKRKPDFFEQPCKDLVLSGVNYTTDNVLTTATDDKAVTGAFMPYGTSSSPGQVVKGALPCGGSVLRLPLNGGKVELVAWGLRNPYGLAIAPDGKLYATENAFDERGSRPVWGTGDVLWEIKDDMWYGFPDFSAGKPLWDDEEFKSPGEKKVKRLLQQHPNTPPAPAAIFGVHASANGFDFSRSDVFGFKGEAFVAQLGDMAPNVGKVMAPVGFKVVRAHVETGVVRDFAVNKGKRAGPASWLKGGGLERPLSVKFNPSGNAMYIIDFGVMPVTKAGPQPQKGTGVIWKVTKGGN